MNKKVNRQAFTLIELLGVLTILAVISLITIPIVSYSINNGRQTLYKSQNQIILKGAMDWASNNTSKLPVNSSDEENTLTITLGLLKSEGYLNKKIKNPMTGYLYPNDLLIQITYDDSHNRVSNDNVKYNGYYRFEVIEDSGTDLQLSTDIPIISLNVCGSNTNSSGVLSCIERNLDLIYDGYSVEDINLDYYLSKNQPASLVSYTYNNQLVETIDMSKYGFYYVYYTSTSGVEIMDNVKIFMINDTEIPEIVFDSNYQKLYSLNDTIDLKENVTCTDNSGSCNLKVSGYINPNIKDKYVITYIAYDNSGNTAKQKQVITVK